MNTNKETRYSWIDIAKGILICFVVIGHVGFCVQDEAYKDVYAFTSKLNPLFISYYMPAFFVITGMCSSFNKPFGEFFVKNFKALIIPNILIGIFFAQWLNLFLSNTTGLSYLNILDIDYWAIVWNGGGQCFLSALFIAKIIMYFIYKYLFKYRKLTAVLLMSVLLLASVLYNKKLVPNVWFFEQALLLLPFMYAGVIMKDYTNYIRNNKLKILILGVLSLVLWMTLPLFGISSPYVIGVPSVYWGNFIFFVIIALLETMALCAISMIINISKPLQTIGKHTLTTYLLHFSILAFLLRCSFYFIDINTHIAVRIIALVLIILTSIFLSVIIDMWIDKHVKFLKGKF